MDEPDGKRSTRERSNLPTVVSISKDLTGSNYNTKAPTLRSSQNQSRPYQNRTVKTYTMRPQLFGTKPTDRQNVDVAAKYSGAKYEYARPIASTSTIAQGSNYNQHRSTSSEGAIKKTFRHQYERTNQNQKNKFPAARRQHNERVESEKFRGMMGFKQLEGLLELKEEDFVLKVSREMPRLAQLVDSINLTDDTCVLIIRLLKKIFDSRFPHSQQLLLQTVLKERLVDNLQRYLCCIPSHDENQKLQNSLFWKDTNNFWTILIDVSRRALELLPSYTSNLLPKVISALRISILSFEEHQKIIVPPEIKKELEEVSSLLNTIESRIKKGAILISTRCKTGKKIIYERDEPPDNFRTIRVYPDSAEILTECSFLRPNVIDGPYRDVEHYLDVQFRLLREDFVNPLRSGVRAIQSGENVRHENVRVYRRIRFLRQEVLNEYYCLRLRFNFNKQSCDFNNENSKKFMFGTLLCFTRDNFVTLKFGRVVKRDREDLMKGELVVGFDTSQQDLNLNIDYLMIECGVYFEPYFHVLTALQNINEDDFAMKRYIVDVQCIEAPPSYVERTTSYKIDKRVFSFGDLMCFTDNLYNFNDSQAKAFKAGLTKEFAMIQGPPGTGKTYVGLQIVKTLLENKDIWWHHTPMLVICFTNHALDQFLEGLLDTTCKIVRMGGQSKSESLTDLNISNLRRESTGRAMQSRKVVQEILKELGSTIANLRKIDQCTGVIAYWELYKFIPEFKEVFPRELGPKYYMEWLLEGYREYFERKRIGGRLHCDTRICLEDSGGYDNYQSEFIVRDNGNAHSFDGSLAQELFANMEFPPNRSAITIGDLWRRMSALKCEIAEMENSKQRNPHQKEGIDANRRVLLKLEAQFDYLSRRLNKVGKAMQNDQVRPDIKCENPKLLPHDGRWALYTSWLSRYRQHLEEQLPTLSENFRRLYKQYEEMQNLEDTLLLRQTLVVGMTTTCAARLRSVLEGLHSPIVIVEEAAEVLEAHIISTLTKHCKHLILIGDHKQLKPSSADYKITKDYNLGISLFERMVNNGIQCHTLNVQHRMRPEISELICPIIYPGLEDHESVFNRPSIAGIDSYVRFIDHSHPEDDCGDNRTKKNSHEVKFAVALARHLILNGYKSEQVTILVTYLGQMFAMLEERRKHGSILENVRIAVLDNYQGEESDIIILSLVRSNSAQRIGFLATENRVCVALSRARNGFYIIGNMGLLSSVSKLWGDVKKTLEMRNAIGPDLILRCRIHTNITTSVREGADFEAISEGGCTQICQGKLNCGHFCKSLCHIRNREHADYECLERCTKVPCDYDASHVCQKKCYEECGPCTYIVPKQLECGHEVSIACNDDKCPVIVPTKLPCDHVVDKQCHEDADTMRCPEPCEITVDPCGHSCTKKCHIRDDPDHSEYECTKQCSRPLQGCRMEPDSAKHMCLKSCYEECDPCNVITEKRRTKCSHVYKMACSVDVDSIQCKKPCTEQLSCGHPCKQECYEPCDPSSCSVKVRKILSVCGHKVLTPCNSSPLRNMCDGECPRTLPCGHPCTRKCNQECTPQCKVLVDCQLKGACGHSILQMQCGYLTSGLKDNDKKLLACCSEPCNVKLKCGHQCSGKCGECLQGRFHKRCSKKCGTVLICNHECRFPCREACRPCDKICTYRCVHSVCKKKCGEICVSCKEPCQRRCEHQRCSQPCSSFCDVTPCMKPCSKSLECGHNCIGFCGEPCPPKCLVCDREELLESDLLFGYEDDNSRFVLLADCKHIIESEGMERWLKMGDDSSAIGVKVCPKCRTPIRTTLRYGDHIKRAIVDVNKVKMKAIGSTKKIKEARTNLIKRTVTLRVRMANSLWESFIQTLDARLQLTQRKRRQQFSMILMTSIEAKLQVLEHLLKIFECPKEFLFCPQYQEEIHNVLTRDIEYITNQEIEDVMHDLKRLHRAIQLERMKRSPMFLTHANNPQTKHLIQDIEVILNRSGPYADDDKVKPLLAELKKILGSQLPLTDVEKREVVRAMSMKLGHWFKCPNGHPYVIGDCGGAMVISRCNECGAKIGGQHHNLLASNRLAGEMDGASHPAWSEAANNMGNFMNLR